ncbi:hypothetical protein AOLI_G00049340 [Acnodon oligacanthus]
MVWETAGVQRLSGGTQEQWMTGAMRRQEMEVNAMSWLSDRAFQIPVCVSRSGYTDSTPHQVFDLLGEMQTWWKRGEEERRRGSEMAGPLDIDGSAWCTELSQITASPPAEANLQLILAAPPRLAPFHAGVAWLKG